MNGEANIPRLFSRLFVLNRAWLKQLGIIFLILGSTGLMIENIIFIRIPDVFDFGLSYLVAGLSALLFFTVYGIKFRNKQTFNLWFLLIFISILGGVIRYLSGEFILSEWAASFGLFLFSTSVFMITSGYTITLQDIKAILPAFIVISIGFSLLTIIQFVLGNVFGLLIHLPFEWLKEVTVNYTMFQQRVTSYGIFRAFGFAAEPSYQSISLANLLALAIFFFRIKLFTGINFWFTFAILGLAIILTFSVGGWLITLFLVVFFILKKSRYVILSILFVYFLGIILILYPGTPQLLATATDRLQSVISLQDRSAQGRISSSFDVLLLPPRDIVDALFGTGLGLQKLDLDLQYLDIKYEGGGSVYNPNNTLAKIKVIQGFSGLVVFVIVSWSVFNPLKPKFKLLQPLFIVWFIKLFASGLYLVPTYWCFMALVVALRDTPISRLKYG